MDSTNGDGRVVFGVNGLNYEDPVSPMRNSAGQTTPQGMAAQIAAAEQPAPVTHQAEAEEPPPAYEQHSAYIQQAGMGVGHMQNAPLRHQAPVIAHAVPREFAGPQTFTASHNRYGSEAALQTYARPGHLESGYPTQPPRKRTLLCIMKAYRITTFCVCLGLILLIVGIVLIVLFNIRQPSSTPTPSPSTTATPAISTDPFPALPTGQVFIRPFAPADSSTACVAQNSKSFWSCELPSDSHFPATNTTSTGTPAPAFNFIITHNSTLPKTGTSLQKPLPSPPALADYSKLALLDTGVANNTGEATPYTISLLTSNTPGVSRRAERPANVLPAVLKNQPLRLFNRGQDDAHYGFHAYFDKTIHFRSDVLAGTPPNDVVGGLPAGEADMKVTWRQTRFKVAIWLAGEKAVKVGGGGDEEFDFPVSVWEDRVGGVEKTSTVMVTGVAGVRGVVETMKAVGATERGCSCFWKNWQV